MIEHGCSFRVILPLVVAGAVLVAPASAQTPAPGQAAISIPDISNIIPMTEDRQGVSATLQIFVIMTVLTLVPSILIMMTSFTRIIIVLGLMRQALATPQLPPGQILLGLARLRAEQLGSRNLKGLAIWDGAEGDGPGGTASTVEVWKRQGLDYEIVATSRLDCSYWHTAAKGDTGWVRACATRSAATGIPTKNGLGAPIHQHF